MKHTDGSKVRVMIRCSITGEAIATGLMADPASWDARPIEVNRALCPACKQSHALSKKDAFLEGSGGSL